MFSVVILTLNEEKALPACLDSLAACDDVVILDSGSSDRTVALATSRGARVVKRPFDTFAGQRNFAQREIQFRHPWVFHLDADERMVPELAEECLLQSVRSDLDGFRVAPKMIFEGRWIPHCTDFPAYQARLVRAPEFKFVQIGHGQRESPDMRTEALRCNYLHDMSIYGLDAWIDKHRRYAHAEAVRVMEVESDDDSSQNLFSPDALRRRRALKRLSFRFPFRPALRFAYQYGLRRGFLDGGPGFRYCRLLSQYEGFIADEIRKLKQSNRQDTP